MFEQQIVRRSAIQTVEKSHAFQVGECLLEAVKVVCGRWRAVPDITHEWPFRRPNGVVFAESPGEGLQYRQVRRAFEIKNPPGLLILVVLIEPDFRQRLTHLTLPVSDPVRFTDEGDDQIPFGGFVQKHLRMARRDTLIAAVRSDLGYQSINLALARD